MLVQFLHPGSHVERPDGREREAALFAPGKKPAACPGIGSARVRITDIGGEEFDIAPARVIAAISDQRWQRAGRGFNPNPAVEGCENRRICSNAMT